MEIYTDNSQEFGIKVISKNKKIYQFSETEECKCRCKNKIDWKDEFNNFYKNIKMKNL